MKNTRLLIAAVLLLSAACLEAQDRQLMTITVPFSFTAENVTLPAGSYRVSTLPPYNMIRMQSNDGHHVAAFPVIPTPSPESKQSKLVFHCLAGQYFLAQILEQRSGVHRDLHNASLARRAGKAREQKAVCHGSCECLSLEPISQMIGRHS